jgi:hypothetical protein
MLLYAVKPRAEQGALELHHRRPRPNLGRHDHKIEEAKERYAREREEAIVIYEASGGDRQGERDLAACGPWSLREVARLSEQIKWLKERSRSITYQEALEKRRKKAAAEKLKKLRAEAGSDRSWWRQEESLQLCAEAFGEEAAAPKRKQAKDEQEEKERGRRRLEEIVQSVLATLNAAQVQVATGSDAAEVSEKGGGESNVNATKYSRQTPTRTTRWTAAPRA